MLAWNYGIGIGNKGGLGYLACQWDASNTDSFLNLEVGKTNRAGTGTANGGVVKYFKSHVVL